MIKLYDKESGEHIGNAIKYDGTNKIEYNMFGVTGTAQGRKTKIDCQGKAFVRNGIIFERVKNGYYVVQHGLTYKQMPIYDLMDKYNFEGE